MLDQVYDQCEARTSAVKGRSAIVPFATIVSLHVPGAPHYELFQALRTDESTTEAKYSRSLKTYTLNGH